MSTAATRSVVILGSSGMVGGLVLRACLARPDVARVTTLVRKPSGASDPKLRESVHTDFLDYTQARAALAQQDVAFHCLGVYSNQVSAADFHTITVDYTRAFGAALRSASPRAAMCFFSSAGAREKSPIMFMRAKGAAENALRALGFERLHIVRPGYIYPVRPRREPNRTHRWMRALYPLVRHVWPNIGLTSDELARVMVDVGLNGDAPAGGGVEVLENRDIRARAARLAP
jgi:uncharacterized protein YbjT (DUF2867 family)